MSCKCYKVGGPFVAEDSNCPIHGYEAQERKRSEEKLNSVIDRLSERIEIMEREIRKIKQHLRIP